MDISAVKAPQTHERNIRADSHDGKAVAAGKPEAFNPKQAKQLTEAMVLQQLINIDLGSTSKSQELLLRKVIEKLDAILAPTAGPDATQKAIDKGVDFSPEATAQRITSHAAGMIARFQSEHQLEQGDAKLENFVNLIQGGIEKGFAEAKGILGGLDVFKGNTESTFDATHAEVIKNMNAIREILGLELIITSGESQTPKETTPTVSE